MAASSNLIEALAGDLRPAPRAWIARRLAIGLLAGFAVSAALTLGLWGVRPDLATAVGTWPFWAKLSFAGLLTVSGVAAMSRLARPGLLASGAGRSAAATLAVTATLAVVQYMGAPPAGGRALVLGGTASTCPWLIMALAVPAFAGGLWALRAAAPTRLVLAGAALGLTAGAGAAAVYSLSCDEVGVPFVVLWYGLGIAVPTVIGALVGSRLLRW